MGLVGSSFRMLLILGWEWDVLGWLAVSSEVALTGGRR